MATRQKKTLIQGITAEQANDAFASYAKADAQIQKINADIELQCAKIREKRADELTRLGEEREQAFDTLQAYAVENQAELFTTCTCCTNPAALGKLPYPSRCGNMQKSKSAAHQNRPYKSLRQK